LWKWVWQVKNIFWYFLIWGFGCGTHRRWWVVVGRIWGWRRESLESSAAISNYYGVGFWVLDGGNVGSSRWALEYNFSLPFGYVQDQVSSWSSCRSFSQVWVWIHHFLSEAFCFVYSLFL
jgi:hypothetical protein